ncbi:hypothetical protein BT93_E2771 [Corymbia citriodora subsp. variegata]|nr:hypothetical protein BT93_E2771 [Corymbia citriodora subsp. variegata]
MTQCFSIASPSHLHEVSSRHTSIDCSVCCGTRRRESFSFRASKDVGLIQWLSLDQDDLTDVVRF